MQTPVVDHPAALANLEAHGLQGVAEATDRPVALGGVLPERIVAAGQHGQVVQGAAVVLHVVPDHVSQRRAAEQRHRGARRRAPLPLAHTRDGPSGHARRRHDLGQARALVRQDHHCQVVVLGGGALAHDDLRARAAATASTAGHGREERDQHAMPAPAPHDAPPARLSPTAGR